MPETNQDTSYEAYGHYGYYKKRILEKMFDISELMELYLSVKMKDSKISPSELKKIWGIPLKLRVAIIELIPKLDSLTDKKKNYAFDGIEKILTVKNIELIENTELLINYYQKYVMLIEALGYSDMNIIKEAKDLWD